MLVKGKMGKEKLTYYYMKDFDMQEYFKQSGETDRILAKMMDGVRAQIRDEYVNKVCDELLKYIDRDKVEKIRKMAKNLTKEEFEEMVESARLFANMMASSFNEQSF